MVGVDPASRAEIVLRRFSVEFIEGQQVFPLDEFDTVKFRRHGNGATHPAVRAGAAPDGVKLVCQLNFELDRTAMTCGAMDFCLFTHVISFWLWNPARWYRAGFEGPHKHCFEPETDPLVGETWL